MRKLIAAMNMTIDGYCDHTAGIPDDDLHRHYTNLLESTDTILYGRITYQLMEYWRSILESPTGNKDTDDFAVAMDKIHKIVFSRTLKTLDWKSASLATRSLSDEVIALKQQSGRDVFVGSPGLIASLTELDLIDEYQLCIHPVILGAGLPLFKNITQSIELKFLKSFTFQSGSTILYYRRENK